MKKVVAIIPARSGSVRVKNKNIRKLGGITLIEHAVRFAENCEINEIILSSDSSEFLDTVVGDRVIKHKRSRTAASNEASDFDVLTDIANANLLTQNDTTIVWLRPCSPFRSIDLFNDAIEMFYKHNENSVRSIKPIAERPEWMTTLRPSGELDALFNPETLSSPSNNFPQLFIWSGQLDVFSYEKAMRFKQINPPTNFGIVDERTELIVDIDTEHDFQIAKIIFDNKFSVSC